MTTTTLDWLAVGRPVAVLTNHKGQWTSIEVPTPTSVTLKAIKFDNGETLKLTARTNRQPQQIRIDADGVNVTWLVPPGSDFHREALVWMIAGDWTRDANGALHVLKQHNSALAARSAADALEIAARQLREAATALDEIEES